MMRFRRWLGRIAWPVYSCEQCIGQERGTGCWCEYHGASAPGIGPEKWRTWLRKLVP